MPTDQLDEVNTRQIIEYSHGPGEIVAMRPETLGDQYRNPGTQRGTHAIPRILDSKAVRALQTQLFQNPAVDIRRRFLGSGLLAGADHLEAIGREIGQCCRKQHIDIGA